MGSKQKTNTIVAGKIPASEPEATAEVVSQEASEKAETAAPVLEAQDSSDEAPEAEKVTESVAEENDEMFEKYPGILKYYKTSDGQVFRQFSMAYIHAQSLQEDTVTIINRGDEPAKN